MSGLYVAGGFAPDAILLDLTIPATDKYDALRQIRQITGTPIILLGSTDTESEKVKGLNLGAAIEAARRFREIRPEG